MREVLERIVSRSPRCCSCGVRIGVIVDPYRWTLCEPCWWNVPGSDTDVPSVDLRDAVYRALAALA